MTLTLGMIDTDHRSYGDNGGREEGLGPLAKTIIALADYVGTPPETKLIEPYSERETTVAEYIQPFKNEKIGLNGYKVNPDVLPLDVLGVYLIQRRRFPQVQVVFEAPIDIERMRENLTDDESGIKITGKTLKHGETTLLVINKECAVITIGRTNPKFLMACGYIEGIHNSGSFSEKESDRTENIGEPIGRTKKMELKQQMDLRMDTRLAVIEEMEGTMRTEQRMEMRQIMAIRLAHVTRTSTDELRNEIAIQTGEAIEEGTDGRRNELAKQTDEARKAFKAVVRALANRIMRETPSHAKPRNFGAAMRMAYNMVNNTTHEGRTGRQTSR